MPSKDKNSNARSLQRELPDEIALRDEIFQLKRQIMLLKKENERNLIRVRKYEDEAKKKDRQIEQLMDPVKNGDVRKLLSMKGAALLLNLKEQNNTLIHIVLDKDIQIRKLLSEIKTSKLYTTANTKRTDSYRNEIDRLRNLLIESHNVLKETQEIPQRRSICVGRTPTPEMTMSSDPSSPRELEELQSTIRRLEMHMKRSNELLARKNEQIVQLAEQLNEYQCSTCRKSLKTNYHLEMRNNFLGNDSHKVDVLGETAEKPSTSSFNALPLFEKNKGPTDKQRLANSAPAVSLRSFPDISPRREPSHACDTCPNEGEGYMQFIEIHQSDKTDASQHLTPGDSHETERDSDTDSELDTAEFEMMERKIENDQIEFQSSVKLTLPLKGESDDRESAVSTVVGDSETEGSRESGVEPQVNQNFESKLHPEDVRSFLKPEGSPQLCDLENQCIDMRVYDETITKSFNEIYGLCTGSSCDSESITDNIHEVQVLAEINHNSFTNSEQKEESMVTTVVIDEDDDDDVVVIR